MTVHTVTTLSPNTFDLSDHIDNVPHLELQAHLHRGLINNCDFMMKSAVYTAYRYLREEVLDVSNATITEIADAVRELSLAEISFFEAGSSNPSMIDLLQHLNHLRETWIERAETATRLVDGRRSTVSDLWAQAERKQFKVPSLEEQFLNPTFNVSRTVQQKIKLSVQRQAQQANLSSEDIARKIDAHLKRAEARSEESEQNLAERAPIYNSLLLNMLSTDTSVFNTTETRDGRSTQDNPSRKVYIATNSFSSLPYKVRKIFIERSIQDAERFREWSMDDRRVSFDDMIALDLLIDKFVLDLNSVIKSPAFTVADRVDEAATA